MNTRPLDLFNERAIRLKNSRFLNWLLTSGNRQPNLAKLNKGEWLSYGGLSHEDLDSFCLNLRLLMQDRDGFSIRCLSELYESYPEDYNEAKKLFFGERNNLEKFLKKKSIVQLQKRPALTNRDIFNIVFYGGLAHNDEKYYSDYLALTKCGVFSTFTFVTLWNIILRMNTCIQRIAILNREIIKWEMESHNALHCDPSKAQP